MTKNMALAEDVKIVELVGMSEMKMVGLKKFNVYDMEKNDVYTHQQL